VAGEESRIKFAPVLLTQTDQRCFASLNMTVPGDHSARCPNAHVSNPQEAIGVSDNVGKRRHDYLSGLKLQIPIPKSQTNLNVQQL